MPETFFVKWRDNHLREQLFCGEKRRVLLGRVTEMGATLGEVCRVTRRLCWKKIMKKFLVSLLGRKLFRPPSYKVAVEHDIFNRWEVQSSRSFRIVFQLIPQEDLLRVPRISTKSTYVLRNVTVNVLRSTSVQNKRVCGFVICVSITRRTSGKHSAWPNYQNYDHHRALMAEQIQT